MGFQALLILLLPASLCGCVLHGHVFVFLCSTFYLVGHTGSPSDFFGLWNSCFWGKVYVIRESPWIGERYQ